MEILADAINPFIVIEERSSQMYQPRFLLYNINDYIKASEQERKQIGAIVLWLRLAEKFVLKWDPIHQIYYNAFKGKKQPLSFFKFKIELEKIPPLLRNFDFKA